MNFKMILTCSLLVLVFVLGYILSAGKAPYSSPLLTAHKLLSLIPPVLLIVLVKRFSMLKQGVFADRAAFVLFIVFILITFASGGIISAKSTVPEAVRWSHKIAPYLATATGLFTYFRISFVPV